MSAVYDVCRKGYEGPAKAYGGFCNRRLAKRVMEVCASGACQKGLWRSCHTGLWKYARPMPAETGYEGPAQKGYGSVRIQGLPKRVMDVLPKGVMEVCASRACRKGL